MSFPCQRNPEFQDLLLENVFCHKFKKYVDISTSYEVLQAFRNFKSSPSPSVQVLAHLINWTQLRAVCNYSTQCFCTSCRVTTGAHQLICPSAGRSVVAVFLYQWSTLPT